MWTYLIAGVVGALYATRKKPVTKVIKHECFGSRSGTKYLVEEIPETGVVVVRANDGSVAVMRRTVANSFALDRGRGNPNTIRLIESDFCGK